MGNNGDDSEDDLLLSQEPTFSRSNSSIVRRSKRRINGRNLSNSDEDDEDEDGDMLRYLDECVESEQERSDRRDRIEDMIRHESVTSEVFMTEVIEEEEEEEEGENAKIVSNDDIGKQPSGMERRDALVSVSHSRGRNDVEMSASENSKLIKKTPYDIDDPKYWARIAAASQSSSTKLTTSQRRRKLDDEVEGIDRILGYDDDKDVHEGCIPRKKRGETEKIAMSREDAIHRKKKMALAGATATGLSSNTGVRSMLAKYYFGTSVAYSSFEVALDYLSHWVREMKETRTSERDVNQEKRLCQRRNRNGSEEQKDVSDFGRKKKRKRQNLEDDTDEEIVPFDLLLEKLSVITGFSPNQSYLLTAGFLQNGSLSTFWNKSNNGNRDGHDIPFPFQLWCWLWNLACAQSSRETEKEPVVVVPIMASEGACRTLLDIMEGGFPVEVPTNKKTKCVTGQHSKSGKLLLTELVPSLQREFGFKITHCPPPKSDPPSLSQSSEFKHVAALGNFLDLWLSAVSNGFVDFCHNSPEEEMERPLDDILSASLAALICMGLDPCFHEGKRLLPSLIRLILSLIESSLKLMAQESTVKDTSREILNIYVPVLGPSSKCFRTIIENIFHSCQGLGNGMAGSADEDDTYGFLPLSLAVRIIPAMHEGTGDVSMPCATLKAALAERALCHCIFLEDQSTKNWDGMVESVISKRCGNLAWKVAGDSVPVRWRAIASAEVGLNKIYSMNALQEDGPRFLSSIELVSSCMESSLSLFRGAEMESSSTSSENTVCIYGGIAEANAISHFLQKIETMCAVLKKGVTAVFVFPHLRRVKELLTWLVVLCRHLKKEADEPAQARITPVKKDVVAFFPPAPGD